MRKSTLLNELVTLESYLPYALRIQIIILVQQFALKFQEFEFSINLLLIYIEFSSNV